jgi:hypothetical protein
MARRSSTDRRTSPASSCTSAAALPEPTRSRHTNSSTERSARSGRPGSRSRRRAAPADRRRRDPQIGVVEPDPKLVLQLRHLPGRLRVHVKNPDMPERLRKLLAPSHAPACDQRPEPRLRDCLRNHHNAPTHGVLGVLRFERAVLSRSRREDVRVDGRRRSLVVERRGECLALFVREP